MDLDEMKTVWSEMSDQLEKQKKLTNEIILKMTEQQYKAKANRIIIPELIGALICFVFAGILLFNFHKLDHWLTITSGVLAVLMLIGLPLMSIRMMKNWNSKINISENTYQKTIRDFANVKRKFQFVKRFSYLLGISLIFIILPPLAKIWKDKDVFEDITIWYKVPFGILFVAVFVFFTMRFYSSNIKEIDDMLNDIETEK